MANLGRYSPGELPKTGYLRQSQLIPGILPFSSATLWRMVKSGDFPAPVKLSERVTAWRVEDLRSWMDSRMDSSVSSQGQGGIPAESVHPSALPAGKAGSQPAEVL